MIFPDVQTEVLYLNARVTLYQAWIMTVFSGRMQCRTREVIPSLTWKSLRRNRVRLN